MTMEYPVPDYKNLALSDSFYCRRVGCQPYPARAYGYYWIKDPRTGLWAYRHGGNDPHGPEGARLVAVYDGVIRWVAEGSAFGYHQFCIVDSLGRGFHYKHTKDRPPNGKRVSKGDLVAHIGTEGGVPAHLHFGIYKVWNDHRTVINPHPFLMAAKAA